MSEWRHVVKEIKFSDGTVARRECGACLQAWGDNGCDAERVRLRAVEAEDGMTTAYMVGYEQGRTEAVTAALARLRDVVKGLPKWNKRTVPGGIHVNRAAVLRAIDKEAGK